jgi:hypothetical protein
MRGEAIGLRAGHIFGNPMLSSHILCVEHSNVAFEIQVVRKPFMQGTRPKLRGAVKSIRLGILTRRALMPAVSSKHCFQSLYARHPI